MSIKYLSFTTCRPSSYKRFVLFNFFRTSAFLHAEEERPKLTTCPTDNIDINLTKLAPIKSNVRIFKLIITYERYSVRHKVDYTYIIMLHGMMMRR
jgi:NAD-dependent SIR2 family protein deacetylase